MNNSQITVAVDAHGTDFDTRIVVEGALEAIQKLGARVILVGDKDEIEKSLGAAGWIDGLEHVQASEVIEMHEEPAAAVRKKNDSSIVVSARLVKEGKAHAMVGAGNTGAMMAAALLTLGRIPGVSRPGIAVELPAPGSGHGNKTRQILMDAGATVDPEPAWMVQHALMARAYVEHRLEIDEPTIGLLSNGEEASKGDELRKKTFELLKDIPGFIGNCEGRNLTTGQPTIVLSDGFTGNVALKTMEAVSRSMSTMVMEVLMEEELRDASAQVVPALLQAAQEIHPDTYGGAVLLGVNSPVVISHGSASESGIFNAIRVATECVSTGVVEAIREALGDA